jgi:hypothetical protein
MGFRRSLVINRSLTMPIPTHKLILAAIGGTICLGLALLLGGVIGFAVGRYTAPSAAVASTSGDSKTTDVRNGTKSDGNDQADRAALMAFVKSHAQDPADLDILELKPASPGKDGQYTRSFRIRCKLLEHSPDTVNAFGKGGLRATKVQPKPISLDTGFASYSKDGKIAQVHLDQCGLFWNP